MDLKAKIEAVLFITARALEIKEIAQVLEQDELTVEEALLELMFDYSSRDSALEIDDENGYILQVKTEHMDIVEKLCPVELKPAVLKTLTVIALKEPIRQSELKDLRGSTAYDHIPELLEKGLISRSRDKNGRSFNIKTTPKFAEYFKLKGDAKTLSKILDLEKLAKDNQASGLRAEAEGLAMSKTETPFNASNQVNEKDSEIDEEIES